jgi:hypothetical protein
MIPNVCLYSTRDLSLCLPITAVNMWHGNMEPRAIVEFNTPRLWFSRLRPCPSGHHHLRGLSLSRKAEVAVPIEFERFIRILGGRQPILHSIPKIIQDSFLQSSVQSIPKPYVSSKSKAATDSQKRDSWTFSAFQTTNAAFLAPTRMSAIPPLVLISIHISFV